jgi:pyrimidine operon attenuation protein/uracil phosphoribosyltransferase
MRTWLTVPILLGAPQPLTTGPARPGRERQTTTLLSRDDVRRAITRIAHEIVERERDLSSLGIVGIRSRGDALARRLRDAIRDNEGITVPLGALDITLYRDDLTRVGYAPVVRETAIDFTVDGRVIVLVDDVLFTGRTIRAAMDALVDFGRPRAIRLAVLIDRGHRELPIRADFVGKNVPTAPGDDVRVRLAESDGRDEVELVQKVPA